MHQSGAVNPASGLRFTGQPVAFPGQPVLDHAIRTLQELSAGNVHYMSAISSALLKWATVFQRVAGDVSELLTLNGQFIYDLMRCFITEAPNGSGAAIHHIEPSSTCKRTRTNLSHFGPNFWP
jgi:hypothetical protein